MGKWQKIITDLRAKGWSQVEIAEYAGCSQPHIGRLQRDRNLDPKWSIGDALCRLHKKVK